MKPCAPLARLDISILPHGHAAHGHDTSAAHGTMLPGTGFHGTTLAGYALLLRSRPILTPCGHPLVVPSQALAEAVRDELAATPAILAGRGLEDPKRAPFWRLSQAGIDLVAEDDASAARILQGLLRHAETELVCHRVTTPEPLADRQRALWDPLLAWLESRLGARLVITDSLLPVAQPAEALERIEAHLRSLDPMALAALSLAVGAAGSLVIGLALIDGAIDPETAFQAALLEELYQAGRWGEDEEAARARAGRLGDLEQAAAFVHLLKDGRQSAA